MTKEIVIQGLPMTKGWDSLNQQDKEWMQEHTSIARGLGREAGIKAVELCLEVASIHAFLDDKPMPFTGWAENCFPGAFGVLKLYNRMRQKASDNAIRYLAKEGIAGMANIHGGDIALAMERVGAAPEKSSQFYAWGKQLEAEVRAERSNRRKGIKRKLDPDDATKMFVTFTARLLRETKITDSASQRSWLKKSVGYLMEKRAITGTVSTERIAIPDGYMPKVGYPRGKKRSPKAA